MNPKANAEAGRLELGPSATRVVSYESPKAAQSALGIFFALTGALIATSIFNLGDSGIPVFCLAFLVPVLAAPFAWQSSQYFPVTRKEWTPLLSMAAVFLLLSLVTFFQIALNRESATGDLSHAVIRLSFLVYSSICIFFLHGEAFRKCLHWLRRILTVVALYGIYQLPAKILGLPLFLDWLRNNRSFDFYDYDKAGWVSLVRANSIYAEPGQCTVPILVLILLNIYLPAPRYSKLIVWFAALAFAFATFSRTTWLALVTLIAAIVISRVKTFRKESEWGTMLVAALLVLITLIMPLWAFYGGNFQSDLSRQERAGSIVIGLHLVGEHPWIGSGWNSYQTLMPSYQLNVEGVSPYVRFGTIHNMFVSYAEQAGIAGFVLGIFPFLLMLYYSEAPNGLRLGSILSLLAVAELGGDVAYSSLFWLWVAIVLNWPAPENAVTAKFPRSVRFLSTLRR